jgi:uncharacterized membrane protein
MNYLLQLLATLLIFLGFDFIWLKYIIGEMVEWPWIRQFGQAPNWPWAEIYYVAMAVRLTFVSAQKSAVAGDAAPAFSDGARLGFWVSIIYAAFNIVFFQTWPLSLIVLDVAWNTILCAMTAIASYAISNWLTADKMNQRRNLPEKTTQKIQP